MEQKQAIIDFTPSSSTNPRSQISDPEIAIKVENLTKIYKLYDTPMDRLKESINPFGKKYHKDFYALNDVSFEIKKGETVGIIGKNGSGKSTLLKIITGVLTPTSGNVTVNGKVSALLELGAGFNPELTGLENVYFNGTLMGYPKEEIDTKLDEILSFADIGEFIYQPVKTYSSGMFVRLAFALAISIEPEILIVDEALAVGDLRFQKKCKQKMNEFREREITQVIVSHNMSDITTSCKRAVFLKSGINKFYGDAFEVVSTYLVQDYKVSAESMTEIKIDSGGTGDLTVRKVICYQNGMEKGCSQIEYGSDIIIEIEYETFEPIEKPLLRISFSSVGYRFFSYVDFKLGEYGHQRLDGHGVIKVQVVAPNIYPGSYGINIGFLAEDINTHLFHWNYAYNFVVVPPYGKYMQSPSALMQLDFNLIAVN